MPREQLNDILMSMERTHGNKDSRIYGFTEIKTE